MTWSRTKETGRGKLDARFSIEGFPYEFVTSQSMAQVVGDATRIAGLSMSGLTFGYRAGLKDGSIEGEGFTATIADVSKGRLATLALGKKATAACHLTSNRTASDTSLSVTSTAGFASSGVIYVNSEMISYSGKTSTSFTGCTRGLQNGLAQYHYISTGEQEFSTEVTNWPRTLVGRRAWIHVYGEGDSKTGDGTQVFIGFVKSDPSYSLQEGWSIDVGPISEILDSQWGGEVSAPLKITGIHYNAGSPFRINLHLYTNVGVTRQFVEPLYFYGFWQTEQDFCNAIWNRMQSYFNAHNYYGSTSGYGNWTSNMFSVAPLPEGGIQITFAPSATNQRAFYVSFPKANSKQPSDSEQEQDPRILESTDGEAAAAVWYNITSRSGMDVQQPLFAGSLYTVGITGVFARRIYAPTNRAYVGVTPLSDGAAANVPYPANYVYTSGIVPDNNVMVKLETDREGYAFRALRVASASPDPAGSYIGLAADIPNTGDLTGGWWSITDQDTLHVAPPVFKVDSIGSLMTGIHGESDENINRWGAPLTRNGTSQNCVFNLPSTYLNGGLYSVPPRVVTGRTFGPYFEGKELGEILKPEVLAMGHMWSTDSAGRLTTTRLRVASRADSDTTNIDDSEITSFAIERAVYNQISTVVYKSGYNIYEDKHMGTTWVFRNVQTPGITARGTTATIERVSHVGGTLPISKGQISEDDIDFDTAVSIGQRLTGLLGRPYDTVSLSCSLKQFDALIGSTVSVTSVMLPNTTGSFGVTRRLGLVVGRYVDLESGKVDLEILLTDREARGIAPSFLTSGQTNTSGNTWEITVDLTNMSTFTPANTFAVGDMVRVQPWDSTATTSVSGEVQLATSASMTILFASTWTPGSGTWYIRPDVTTAHNSAGSLALKYAFTNNSNRMIEWAGGQESESFTWDA